MDCSDEFRQENFIRITLTNRGVSYAGYEMTRDGFSFLAMGFTGKKAAQWKEKLLKAFNRMERELAKNHQNIEWKAARLQLKSVRRETTDRIKDFVEYATAQGSKNAKMYYANITTMEYKALGFLEQSKSAEGNFRDTLDLLQISQLQLAEMLAANAISHGMQMKMHYRDIYAFAKQKVIDLAGSISWTRLSEPTIKYTIDIEIP
jgi:phage regulator Rha-like protein